MYAKLFTSLYQGTLRGCSDEILVFTNLLAHADSEGVVDTHWKSIAEETGISQKRVKAAVAKLEAPDPESRSPEMDGRRIIPMDEHRAWGWQIVNYVKYRAIRNEEDRREQNRLAQQRWREKHKVSKSKPSVSIVSRDKPPSAHTEEEEDTEEVRKEGIAETAPPTTEHHPTIIAIQEVTGTHPPREIRQDLIDRLGPDIDLVRLKQCFIKWRARGYNKVNYDWVEWYHEGIPEPGKGKYGTSRKPNGHKQTPAEIIASRPYYQDTD